VLGEGSVEFRAPDEAGRSPLAQRLFAIPSVTRIALGADFITVTKADVDALAAAVGDLIDTRIRPAVEGARGEIALRSFADGIATIELGGQPASNVTFRNGIENMLRHYVPEVEEVRFVAKVREGGGAADREAGLDTDEAKAIQALLDDEINPAVGGHGGFVSLVAVKDKRAYLKLEGGCQGCGMASVTLRQGIEVAILEKVPAIEEVLDVTDHAGGTNPYYESHGGGASAY
jgi:Fe-S cluster biogenesis protein NfuA